MPEKKEGPMQDMIDRGNLSLQVTSTIGLCRLKMQGSVSLIQVRTVW